MSEPTAFEQLTVELINRARADPFGELARLIDPVTDQGVQANIDAAIDFFGVDIALLRDQLRGVAAAQPVAWDTALARSSDTHSALMAQFDQQSHFLPGEPGLGDRIRAAGYALRTAAENVFAFAEDALQAHAAFYIDWGDTPTGIQDPAGHRIAILNPGFADIGVGALDDAGGATATGPILLTHHFGSRLNATPKLTGVVIADADADRFYDIGEGLGGVTIRATGTGGSFATTSFASGGYVLAVPSGSYTVTFAGPGLAGQIERSVTVAALNVKLDGIAADAVDPRASLRLVGDTAAQTLTGGPGDDVLLGGGGADSLAGLGGDDRLVGGDQAVRADGGDGDDAITTGDGADTVAGGAGADRLSTGRGDDRVTGGDGADVVVAFEGDDSVAGEAGADRLIGWRGLDTLLGGAGDDEIFGDFDADRIEGGSGADRLTGGTGRDVFVFKAGFGEDRVLDLARADRLDFRFHAGVDGLADLTLAQVGGSAVIGDGAGGRLVLAGVTLAALDDAQFLF